MWDWIDVLSLSWVVPLVLDSMGLVASGIYDYFVGNGDGVIHVIIWGWLAFSVGLYLVKMYFPKEWLDLIGLSDGGQMWDPNVDVSLKNLSDQKSVWGGVFRPTMRAIFAVLVLLQIRPQWVMNLIVDPFLQFGAIYVGAITEVILPDNIRMPKDVCASKTDSFIPIESCRTLTKPLSRITAANNRMIEKGFEMYEFNLISIAKSIGVYFSTYFKGLVDNYTSMKNPLDFITAAPRAAFSGLSKVVTRWIMNIITGTFLIVTFFLFNMFTMLMIIRGIFKVGLALVFYPFRVLIYVIKKPDDDKWIDFYPPLKELISGLKTLVVSMIAASFVLMINVAIVGVLFGLDFNKHGIEGHAITWLSAIMTFMILWRLFDITKKRIDDYVGDSEVTGFYDQVYGVVKDKSKKILDSAMKKWKVLTTPEGKK